MSYYDVKHKLFSFTLLISMASTLTWATHFYCGGGFKQRKDEQDIKAIPMQQEEMPTIYAQQQFSLEVVLKEPDSDSESRGTEPGTEYGGHESIKHPHIEQSAAWKKQEQREVDCYYCPCCPQNHHRAW